MPKVEQRCIDSLLLIGVAVCLPIEVLVSNYCSPLLCASDMSEADADITDLLRASCGIAAASADSMVSSSDEDTSDEAFAGRHAALEAEEQHRFNSFAGKRVLSSIRVSS